MSAGAWGTLSTASNAHVPFAFGLPDISAVPVLTDARSLPSGVNEIGLGEAGGVSSLLRSLETVSEVGEPTRASSRKHMRVPGAPRPRPRRMWSVLRGRPSHAP